MGTVYKRGSKLWIGYMDLTGRQRCVSSGFAVGEETRAKKLLEKIEAKIERERAEGASPDGPLTVRRYAAQWIEARKREGLWSVRDDEARLRIHALPVLGDLVLRDVRPRHFQDLFLDLKSKVGSEKKQLAPATVRHVYGVLHSMFECAVADELIDSNPCVLKKNMLPKKIDKNPVWRAGAIFNREEVIAAIFDARIPEDRRVVYALEFLGGMRFGEVAALRWNHLHKDLKPLGKLVIARSYNTRRRVEKDVKTQRPREMPVHPTLALILSRWWASGWEKTFGRAPNASDLIVPSRSGMNRNSNHMLKRFHEDLERVGLPPRRQHDARRTFISLARADGARGEILEWCTHSPKGDIISLYTTLPWATFCEEVMKLKIEPPPPPPPGLPERAEGGDEPDGELRQGNPNDDEEALPGRSVSPAVKQGEDEIVATESPAVSAAEEPDLLQRYYSDAEALETRSFESGEGGIRTPPRDPKCRETTGISIGTRGLPDRIRPLADVLLRVLLRVEQNSWARERGRQRGSRGHFGGSMWKSSEWGARSSRRRWWGSGNVGAGGARPSWRNTTKSSDNEPVFPSGSPAGGRKGRCFLVYV